MTVKYEYEVRGTKEKTLLIPKHFEFVYSKEEEEWTEEEWRLYEEEFPLWRDTTLEPQDGLWVEEVCVMKVID